MKIFFNNKYYLEHCGVHGWLGRCACCNYTLNNHCRENIFVLSKRYCRIIFFSRNGTSPKKNLVSRNVLRSAARHFPNLKSNVNALCQKKCTQQKKQQNRRRFLKARVIQRLPFRGGIFFFHGNGTGIFLLFFNMIFV